MIKIKDELGNTRFGDKRLDLRFEKIVDTFSENSGTTIPSACGDWAATKAAYRFL